MSDVLNMQKVMFQTKSQLFDHLNSNFQENVNCIIYFLTHRKYLWNNLEHFIQISNFINSYSNSQKIYI